MPVLTASPQGRQRRGVMDSLVEGMRLRGTAVLLSAGSSGGGSNNTRYDRTYY